MASIASLATTTLSAFAFTSLPRARAARSVHIRNVSGASLSKQESLFFGGKLVTFSHCCSRAAVRRQGKLQIAAAAQTDQYFGAGGGGLIAQFTDFFQGILKSINRGQKEVPPEEEEEPEEMGTGKTILVTGATGKTGRYIVKKLLETGHKVVALVASPERAEEVLVAELGLSVGRNPGGGELVPAVGDVLDEASVRSAVAGCDAVICAVGSRSSPEGYKPGSSPEEVYGRGIPLLLRATRNAFDSAGSNATQSVELSIFDFRTLTPPAPEEAEAAAAPPSGMIEAGAAASAPGTSPAGGEERGPAAGGLSDVDGWFVLDDVIMGGISDGRLREGQGGVVFEGTLRAEGGGFSSIRASVPEGPLNLSEFDGITLRVKGDGQRYKIGVRPEAEFKGPPYVAMFDTVRGQWTTVTIPFHQFKAVERSNVVSDAPPVDTSSIHSIQILATLFQFDKQPNPLTTPGPFRLEVASIGAYRSARPQFLLVSSAAVERSAKAVTPELRDRSIPIVKLNPGGVLTWKLQAEDALRASGLSYAIVRPCGLTQTDADQPFVLEVAQGDVITGLLSREEAAAVCVEALESPSTVNTTFEVRRDDLTKGIPMSNWPSLFSKLRPDLRSGMVTIPPPLPEAPSAPPPALAPAPAAATTSE